MEKGVITKAIFGWDEEKETFGLHLIVSTLDYQQSFMFGYDPDYEGIEPLEPYVMNAMDKAQELLEDAGVKSIDQLIGQYVTITSLIDLKIFKEIKEITTDIPPFFDCNTIEELRKCNEFEYKKRKEELENKGTFRRFCRYHGFRHFHNFDEMWRSFTLKKTDSTELEYEKQKSDFLGTLSTMIMEFEDPEAFRKMIDSQAM